MSVTGQVTDRRTLVVTGASRGLGRHICMRAVADGWHVIGLARNVEPLDGVRMVPCDVADFAQVEAAFKTVRTEARDSFFGLVNAAGIASMNLVLMTPPETMTRIIGVNLLGSMHCSQQGGKILARRRTGRIINFSTIAVPLALKGEAVYAASKAGVETFSRAFAREMGDHGVTVNCVAPGPIDTALIAKVPAESIDRIVGQQIITRKGVPDDVWDAVSLLLSPAAGMVTGEVIHIGGA